MSGSFQNVQNQSRAQREEAFTAKSNGVNAMDGGGVGGGGGEVAVGVGKGCRIS